MKDIVGYEGLYAVTSCGKVWSYKRKKFLKPYTVRGGYLQVKLLKDNEKKCCYVHRLIADAYIPNPENLPQINHRDENKTNNCLQNLEWCDAKYNSNYGTRNEKVANSNKKSILQFDLNGNFIKEWKSATDVGREVRDNIYHCLKGDQKTAYGFIWKFKD